MKPCLWCGKKFAPRKAGSPQQFCCQAHCRAYETAARRYVRQEMAQGRLTVLKVKTGTKRARTSARAAVDPSHA